MLSFADSERQSKTGTGKVVSSFCVRRYQREAQPVRLLWTIHAASRRSEQASNAPSMPSRCTIELAPEGCNANRTVPTPSSWHHHAPVAI